jgi:seryl-tRNA synthetase
MALADDVALLQTQMAQVIPEIQQLKADRDAAKDAIQELKADRDTAREKYQALEENQKRLLRVLRSTLEGDETAKEDAKQAWNELPNPPELRRPVRSYPLRLVWDTWAEIPPANDPPNVPDSGSTTEETL